MSRKRESLSELRLHYLRIDDQLSELAPVTETTSVAEAASVTVCRLLADDIRHMFSRAHLHGPDSITRIFRESRRGGTCRRSYTTCIRRRKRRGRGRGRGREGRPHHLGRMMASARGNPTPAFVRRSRRRHRATAGSCLLPGVRPDFAGLLELLFNQRPQGAEHNDQQSDDCSYLHKLPLNYLSVSG